jgi:hypothetical protein
MNLKDRLPKSQYESNNNTEQPRGETETPSNKEFDQEMVVRRKR